MLSFGKKLIATSTLLNLYNTTMTFDMPEEKPFENTVGRRENAGKQQFLHSDSIFYPMKDKFMFSVTFVIWKCFQFWRG